MIDINLRDFTGNIFISECFFTDDVPVCERQTMIIRFFLVFRSSTIFLLLSIGSAKVYGSGKGCVLGGVFAHDAEQTNADAVFL